MWRATLAGLRARKLRLALTALAVVIGTSLVAGSAVLGDTIVQTFDDVFATVNEGKDVIVSPKPAFGDTIDGQGEPLPEAVLPAVRGVAGVGAAEGIISAFQRVTVLDRQGKAPQATGPTILNSVVQDDQLSSSRYERGEEPDAPDEVGLDLTAADRLGYAVGDRLQLITPLGRQTVRLSGAFRFGESNSLAGATLVDVPLVRAQQLVSRPGRFDQVLVRGDGSTSQAELATRIAGVLPPTAEAQTAADAAREASRSISSNLGFIRTALTGFALVALFVGSFIIVNTFSILVTQRTQELGLLRALGASRRQVLTSVMAESVVVGLVGSLLGLVLGILLAIGLKALLDAVFGGFPAEGFVVRPTTVLTTLLLGTVVTTLAGLGPSLRASRTSPLAAMRSADVAGPDDLSRRGALGAVLGLLGCSLVGLGAVGDAGAPLGLGAVIAFVGAALLLAVVARPAVGVLGAPFRGRGLPGRLGIENARRNPRRTASTAAALMVGLGLVGAASTLSASLVATTTDLVERSVRADLIVQQRGFGGGFPSTTTARLAALPGVASATGLRFGPVQLQGTRTELSGIQPGRTGLLALEAVEGSLDSLAEGALLVDARAAEDRGLRVGQEVEVTFARTGPTRLRVGAIYAQNQLAGSLLTSLAVFERGFVDQQDLVALLAATPGQADALLASVTAALQEDPTLEVQTRDGFLAEQKRQIRIALGLVYVLLALSVVVAIIGIVNTLALSVFERTREIGLLRAVGMLRPQVRSMVRAESVSVALLGGVVGLALGVALGAAFVRGLQDEGVTELGLPVAPLVVGLVVAAIAGVLASLYPARKASRMDVLRAITVE